MDKDGSIAIPELEAFMKQLKMETKDDELVILMRRMDNDRDGKASKKEFFEFLCVAEPPPPPSGPPMGRGPPGRPPMEGPPREREPMERPPPASKGSKQDVEPFRLSTEVSNPADEPVIRDTLRE